MIGKIVGNRDFRTIASDDKEGQQIELDNEVDDLKNLFFEDHNRDGQVDREAEIKQAEQSLDQEEQRYKKLQNKLLSLVDAFDEDKEEELDAKAQLDAKVSVLKDELNTNRFLGVQADKEES